MRSLANGRDEISTQVTSIFTTSNIERDLVRRGVLVAPRGRHHLKLPVTNRKDDWTNYFGLDVAIATSRMFPTKEVVKLNKSE